MEREALKLALDLATMHHTDNGYAELRSKVRQFAKEALAQPAQEPDWKEQYEYQKRRAEMWIAKYEKDIGPLEKVQPAQEPESVTYKEVQGSMNALEKGDLRQQVIAEELGQRKLYTTPPQRKPLTDEQLADFLGDEYHTMTAEELRYFRLAEAAHDIKE